MKIDGQCHCGEIKFEGDADPAKIGLCHCADCQALSASLFRTFAVIPGNTFKITSGSPTEYVKTADSGNPRIQAFCNKCGSGLYATDVGDGPKNFNVRLGTIRQRDQLPPTFEVWRESALSWTPDMKIERKFDRGPT